MTKGLRTRKDNAAAAKRPGIKSAKLRAVELATAIKPVLPVPKKLSYWTGWIRSLGAYLMNVGR